MCALSGLSYEHMFELKKRITGSTTYPHGEHSICTLISIEDMHVGQLDDPSSPVAILQQYLYHQEVPHTTVTILCEIILFAAQRTAKEDGP